MTNLPPVAQLSSNRFGGTTFPVEQILNIDTVTMTRLPNNPNRVRVMIINEGQYDIRLSNNPDVSAVSGWLLPASGGVISFDWQEEGEGVTYPIYFLANGGDSDIRVRETIRA